MNRHHSYPYGFGMPAPARYASHGTSSAQSPSANPDEDWTKISDLAERRRIQNRIAQRNYRKKLKRRLEDLERRAGSSSASPEPKHAEIIPSQNGIRTQQDAKKRRSSKPGSTGGISKPTRPAIQVPQPQQQQHFGASQAREDAVNGMFAKQYTRQLSASPPPTLTYSYGPTEGIPALQGGPAYPYNSMPGPYQPAEYPPPPQATQQHSAYLPPPMPMGPSRNAYASYDSPRPDGYTPDDDLMNNFHFSYASVHGIEAPTTVGSFADATYTTAVADSYFATTASPMGSPVSAAVPFNFGAPMPSHPVLGF